MKYILFAWGDLFVVITGISGLITVVVPWLAGKSHGNHKIVFFFGFEREKFMIRDGSNLSEISS